MSLLVLKRSEEAHQVLVRVQVQVEAGSRLHRGFMEFLYPVFLIR